SLERRRRLFAETIEDRLGFLRCRADDRGRGLEPLRDLRQLALRPLPDVSFETTALRVPRGHEPLPRYLQGCRLLRELFEPRGEFLAEANVVEREPGLRCEVLKQLL